MSTCDPTPTIPPESGRSINATSASATPILWTDPAREAIFNIWLADVGKTHSLALSSLRPASADASFRRYLRIDGDAGSLVIMDAPPDKEDSRPFVRIARLMKAAGLRVPDILAWDEAHGFLLLSDLGSHTMMQVIDPAQAPPLALYMEAVDALLRWQLASHPGELPPYDASLLRRELGLFPQWYIGQHRGVTLDEKQVATLDQAFDLVVQENLRWPRVYVHRDFMPRNLMVAEGGAAGLGVLDFQDAVYGPITYDIASLMRDAFLSWEEDFCLDVTVRYWERARKAGLPVGDDFGDFYRGVEWMGLQRHLKVAGIFARLTLRDAKPDYLADAPRFIGYLRATCGRYRELKPLLRLIEKIEGIEVPNAFAFGRT